MSAYFPTIGLETHAELSTNSKVFCTCSAEFGGTPNSRCCPVCSGLPGTLPVLNRKAVEYIIKAGYVMNCDISRFTKWDRKNYFYPDLPKAYQISQMPRPVCLAGKVKINVKGEEKEIRINRIHLEEDAGKLVHDDVNRISLADYNRCGVPLIEIVTEPDFHSADEVVAYLEKIMLLLQYAGICDCKMEQGSIRCDVNISIAPKGSNELGTRTELKNLNSLKAIAKAIEVEIERQEELLDNGERVIQQTRRFNEALGETTAMRSKEDAHDYRYFPDPDLMPVKISREYLESVRAELPEVPFDRQRRYMSEFGLPYSATSVMCHVPEICEYFERAVKAYPKNPKAIANLIVNDLRRELLAERQARQSASGEAEFGEAPAQDVREHELGLFDSKVTPENLAVLAQIIDSGEISKQIGKEVFAEMFASGKSPSDIVSEKGLKQNSDSSELESFCLDAISKNAKAVEQFKAGNEKAINALIGPVMKASKGKANPAMVLEIMKKLINK